MKNNTMIGIFAAILLLALAVGVYAHGGESTASSSSKWNMMGHMNLQEMDDMHESMTQGMDQELKEQMDQMHDGCKNKFKRSGTSGDGMGNMAGSMMNGMMG